MPQAFDAQQPAVRPADARRNRRAPGRARHRLLRRRARRSSQPASRPKTCTSSSRARSRSATARRSKPCSARRTASTRARSCMAPPARSSSPPRRRSATSHRKDVVLDLIRRNPGFAAFFYPESLSRKLDELLARAGRPGRRRAGAARPGARTRAHPAIVHRRFGDADRGSRPHDARARHSTRFSCETASASASSPA